MLVTLGEADSKAFPKGVCSGLTVHARNSCLFKSLMQSLTAVIICLAVLLSSQNIMNIMLQFVKLLLTKLLWSYSFVLSTFMTFSISLLKFSQLVFTNC